MPKVPQEALFVNLRVEIGKGGSRDETWRGAKGRLKVKRHFL
jgi:hypothetical protein